MIAPGLPDAVENELMEEIVSTYGKSIHTWHTDHQKDLPTGIPAIMMAFTKDGQLSEKLVQDRDARFKVSTAEKRENRKNLLTPLVIEGADAWEHGKVRQLQLKKN